MIYDVAVVGLGGMGSSVCAQAAARGLNVAGIEQYSAVHHLGASHGRTRLIRKAYFEGTQYIPLLERAYELWDDLERDTQSIVRSRTGALYVGEPDTGLIAGTLASSRSFGLTIESLDSEELRRRYPAVRALPQEVGIFEAVAGAVFPEAAVRAYLQLASRYEADLRFETSVQTWESRAEVARVGLSDGTIVTARNLVLCVGPWFADLLDGLRVPIAVERNVQCWFEPLSQEFTPDRFCAFALDRDGKFFYGFPDYGDGVKCAFHHSGEFTSPHSIDRTVREQDRAQAHEALCAFVPRAAGRFLEGSVCMYALTRDRHFVIGRHPAYENVFVAGGFSGHGFKFCSVVGEIIANFLTRGTPGHAIEAFSPTRF